MKQLNQSRQAGKDPQPVFNLMIRRLKLLGKAMSGRLF